MIHPMIHANSPQAMLQHMPDTADRSEVESAITSATSGLGLFFQTEPLEVYGKLAQLTKPKAKLVDVAGGEDLHDTIWAVACYWMVGNFYSETVVKTLEHGLHGTQRRTQACATRLGSARHRARPYPLTAADFASASAEIGTNQSTRVIQKEGIEEELVPVNLNMLLELEDVGEEGEPYEDEDDGDGGEDEDEEDEEEQESAAAGGSEGGGGEGSKAEGRLPGWPTNPKVGEPRIQRARDRCADEHFESRPLCAGDSRFHLQGAERGGRHRVPVGGDSGGCQGLPRSHRRDQVAHRPHPMAARGLGGRRRLHTVPLLHRDHELGAQEGMQAEPRTLSKLENSVADQHST